jgi:hypothetical protein
MSMRKAMKTSKFNTRLENFKIHHSKFMEVSNSKLQPRRKHGVLEI